MLQVVDFHQSINPPIHQSTNPSIHQSTNPPIHQSINPPIHQSAPASDFPIALTIAGSDSGGGAGLQADLKTFAALGVHGTSVVTCLTAQNPKEVLGVQTTEPAMVRAQLRAVFAELPPRAVKTGMLYSAEIIAEVARFWGTRTQPPLVVDPVMVATSGARLLEPEAVRLLRTRLLPRATLLTPNLDEAAALTGLELREPEDLREAARLLAREYGCAVLVKGGHLTGLDSAVDVLRVKKMEWVLTAPFVRGVSTHGTGCTYSAAITGYLARGLDLPQAVTAAKTFITEAIARSQSIGDHTVLNYFWNMRPPPRPRPRSKPPSPLRGVRE